jgi:tol-pal system protein YbgF
VVCKLFPLISCFAILLGACSRDYKVESQKFRQELEAQAQARASDRRKMEDLNNRLFLLQDKLETTRVAARRVAKPPRLPVVRIVEGSRPENSNAVRLLHTPDNADSVESSDDRSGQAAGEIVSTEEEDLGTEDVRIIATGTGGSLVTNDDVVYGGAAVEQHRKRPVLRLHNADHPPVLRVRGRERGSVISSPSYATGKHKLPVVPLPSRSKVRRTIRSPGAGTGLAPAPSQITSASKFAADAGAMQSYQAAMQRYRRGQYRAAAAAFSAFSKRFPKHSYTDNSLYWLGESYYDMRQYRRALRTFRRLVEEFPNGNKAPDALLKMGYSYLKLEEKQNARTVLDQVVEIFPKSAVARLASKTLAQLR